MPGPVFVLLAVALTAQAAEGVGTLTAAAILIHATDKPVIDGDLSEAAWQRATPSTGFVQQQPDEGRPATQRTDVRFLYDADTLYVGAMLFDDDPRLLVINELKRDFAEANNDLFGVVLDTFRDGRNAYGFLVNAGGAQRDTLAYDQG
ncbi:MAG: carbohydrate binding family 9 domain-containing protein, partial [Acidobacteria bacterium]|nr:carbohydrate binding family 9 domain-containing protein [Acidobacteriota bacterium]